MRMTWKDRLAQLAAEPTKERWEAALDRASDFSTCAVSEHAGRFITKAPDSVVPKSEKLRDLGFRFYDEIGRRDLDAAEATMDEIASVVELEAAKVL